MSTWSWIWPSVGPTPINQGLDSEMFDRVDYPYSETFVREAIQNSLDARLNPAEPVTIRFMFHEDKLGKRKRFIDNFSQIFRGTEHIDHVDPFGNIAQVTIHLLAKNRLASLTRIDGNDVVPLGEQKAHYAMAWSARIGRRPHERD